MMSRSFIFLLWLFVSANTCVRADGLFDYLDPCIGSKQAFWQEHGSLVHNMNFALEATNFENPSPMFRDWWWGEKKATLRPYFDREVYPMLAQAGATNLEAAFSAWIGKQVESAGGIPKMEQLMTTEYRRLRRLVLLRDQSATLAQLEEERRQLYGSCPQDVANQVFRGVQVVIGAPLGVMARNFEISKRESGEIAKGVAATTGISLGDIQRRGPLGGDNSEARKICNGVAGMFGGKC